MANRNGLLAPQATHGNPEVSYYLRKGEALLDPTLVSPIALISADGNASATQTVTGFEGSPAVASVYTGSIDLIPGTSSLGSATAGVNIRSLASGVAVEVGTDGVGIVNTLGVAGANGVAQVYDELYNQPINTTAVASSTGSLPSAGGLGFSYTPDKTGAYMLQVNINIRNADAIPIDGFIEWVLSAGGGEVQYVSSTLKSLSIAKVLGMDDINGVPGGLAEPVDYSFSNLCFLTAGVPATFTIVTARNSTAGGPQWAIQNYDARLIQMC